MNGMRVLRDTVVLAVCARSPMTVLYSWSPKNLNRLPIASWPGQNRSRHRLVDDHDRAEPPAHLSQRSRVPARAECRASRSSPSRPSSPARARDRASWCPPLQERRFATDRRPAARSARSRRARHRAAPTHARRSGRRRAVRAPACSPRCQRLNVITRTPLVSKPGSIRRASLSLTQEQARCDQRYQGQRDLGDDEHLP